MNRLRSILDLRRLERENRKYLYLGGLIGVIIVSGILLLVPYEYAPWKDTDVYRRIVMRLIEVPPEEPPNVETPVAATKEYSTPADFLERVLEQSPSTLTSSDFTYLDTPPSIKLETDKPKTTEEILGAELSAEERQPVGTDIEIPLSHDLIRDDGVYNFNVMVSPTNKKAVEGYVRLALGWGEHVQPQEQMGVESIKNLAAAVNVHTNIKVTVDRRVGLGKINKRNYPFLYVVTGRNLELNDAEKRAVSGYCFGGGFLFLDFRRTRHIDSSEAVHALMRILNPDPEKPSRGMISLISSTHQLFHCFYDLKLPERYHGESLLYGIYLENDLVGLMRISPFDDYGTFFADEFDRRLGINALVYALTPGNWYDLDRRMAYNNLATGEYIEWYENGRMRFRGRTGFVPAGYSPWLPNGAIQSGRLALLYAPNVTDVSKKETGSLRTSVMSGLYAFSNPGGKIPLGILDQMMSEINKVDQQVSEREPGSDSPEPPPQQEETKVKLIPGRYLFVHNERISFLSREKKLVIPWQGVNDHGQHLVMWGDYSTYEGWYANGEPMYEYSMPDSTYIEWNETGKVIVPDR